jgi:hypothetical protein
MVWKDNLWADDHMMPFNRFQEEYMPLSWFEDPRESFQTIRLISYRKKPKDIIFANFACLRCGLCCKNYEGADILGDLEERLESDGRDDLLEYIWVERFKTGSFGSTIPTSRGSCTLCRKARGKPYYYCRLQDYKDFLPVCRAYLCSKSFPVARLNFRDIDELVSTIGLEEYYRLVEWDWGEEFDWSKSEVKTHPPRCRF